MYKVIFDNQYTDEGTIRVLCDADTMSVAGPSGDGARAQFRIIRTDHDMQRMPINH